MGQYCSASGVFRWVSSRTQPVRRGERAPNSARAEEPYPSGKPHGQGTVSGPVQRWRTDRSCAETRCELTKEAVMSKQTGPEFLRFFIPVVEVVRELGGSGRSAEVTDLVIDRMNIPEEEEAVILKSGQSRIYNQIAWARLYLVKAGLLDSSKRGVWSLTEKGRNAELTPDFALQSCRETQSQIIEQRKQRGEAKAQEAG